MADWTWSSPKPPGKDLFFHKFSPKQPYSVQVFNLNKIPFADGKVSSFISHNKLHWPHPLFPSTWMLWTLSYKTSVTTSPEYFTLWLASGIDCDFWNRGLLFFAALHLLLCSTPIAGCISPSVLSSQWLTGQTQARMNTGFLLWTRWAIKLNQAVTHNTNHSYCGFFIHLFLNIGASSQHLHFCGHVFTCTHGGYLFQLKTCVMMCPKLYCKKNLKWTALNGVHDRSNSTETANAKPGSR